MTGPDDTTYISPTAPSTELQHAESWIGRELDERFVINRYIARGGTGTVFAARDLQLGTDVAIKIMHHNATADVERRFRAEVKVLARLRDPRIIRPLAWGTVSERVYLVTELLNGTPLDVKLRRVGRVPPRRLLSLMIDVCRALTEAHAAGVIHRDLKPGNLFVERSRGGEETCRVLDFGIAKIERDSSLLTAGPVAETDPDLLIGTVNYMSPEQVEGTQVDARSDLYSLGVIMFLGLTGHRPFTGEPVEVLRKHISQPTPAFSDVAPDARIHPELETLVRRLMAKRPEDRPPSAVATRKEMERLLSHPDLERDVQPEGTGRVWVWSAAFVAAFAVVAAGALWFAFD